MGAMLSSHYRRGSRLAVDTFAWLVGARGVAALRALSPSPSTSISSKNNVNSSDSMTLEEQFLCPCYYTENFFIKKVRDRKGEIAPGRLSSRIYTVRARVCVCARSHANTYTLRREPSLPFLGAKKKRPPQSVGTIHHPLFRFHSPPSLSLSSSLAATHSPPNSQRTHTHTNMHTNARAHTHTHTHGNTARSTRGVRRHLRGIRRTIRGGTAGRLPRRQKSHPRRARAGAAPSTHPLQRVAAGEGGGGERRVRTFYYTKHTIRHASPQLLGYEPPCLVLPSFIR